MVIVTFKHTPLSQNHSAQTDPTLPENASLVFGPRPERQELCAALDIPLAPALSEECDCQAVSIVEVAWMSFSITTRAPSQNLCPDYSHVDK